MKKQGLHHKSVELWFHIIIWCHPKWGRPGRAAPLPPLATTLAGALLPLDPRLDTLELHQFVLNGTLIRQFWCKKLTLGSISFPFSKIVVARLVAFTAADRFFQQLWAADETRYETPSAL